MNIKLFCFCFIIALLFAGELKAQNNNVEKAKELWEKVIAAKGGRENLYKVKTLAVSTKSYNPYDGEEFSKSNLVDFYVLPDKIWSWIDQRPGFNLTIRQFDFGKEIGYEISEGHSTGVYVNESRNKSELGKQTEYKIFDNYVLFTRRPEKSQEMLKRGIEIQYDDSIFNENIKQRFFENQLIYLMETKWFQPEIVGLKNEKVKGKENYVIEVSFGRLKIEYFIDPQTYLPNKIRRSEWFD